jgi:hypothetical protein
MRDNYKINLAMMQTLEGLNAAIDNMAKNMNTGFRLMVQEISKDKEREDNKKGGSRMVHTEGKEKMYLNKEKNTEEINIKEKEDSGKILTYSDVAKHRKTAESPGLNLEISSRRPEKKREGY